LNRIESLSQLLETLDNRVLTLKRDECDFKSYDILLEAVSMLDIKTYELFTTFVARTVVHGILFNLQNKTQIH